jgi:predicted transcriptional regulator
MSDEKEGEVTPPMPTAPPATAEDLVALGAKVRASTRKRLRRFAVDQEVEMREVVDQALDAYLRDRNY